MDYKELYDYVLETFETRYEEIDSEWAELDKVMNEAISKGEGEFVALKDISFCLGRLKMLRDVICFLKETELGMMKKGGE